MRVYIQKKSDGEWLNLNCFSAMTWFTEMGYEIVPFVDSSEIKDLTSETPVVGGIGMICKAIAASGKQIPPNIDFPTSLNKYRYRRIWETTLGEIRVNESLWPVFIKPLKEHKRFTGLVIRHFADLLKLVCHEDDLEVMASEPVRFSGEYRCFVLDRELLDMRRYAGSLDYYPDISVVKQMIQDFGDEAPRAYSIDVGRILNEDNSIKHHTALVEVNDGYALGIYGLPAFKQVKMIIARWKEIMK